MSFDDIIDRRGTHSAKWDKMHDIYGVSPDDGLAMWVADMDFRPPQVVRDALAGMLDHGVFGYYGDDAGYRESIRWWMETRHDWDIDPAHIFTTHGLVNGTALCLDAFTKPGDAVVLFTPVYHAFARVIRASGREVRELEMPIVDGRYTLDFEAFDAQMTGAETLLMWCSPHNPGGRVWSRDEQAAVADFARRHELTLVSDEIHHDLTMPGQTHVPMALIEGVADRLVTMTASSKTFNLAGGHTGNVIIADPDLRKRFAGRMAALGLSPNSFGLVMTEAAYSPEGAAWVDDLTAYLDGNRQLLDAATNAIPGVRSMPLEATYLSWVDFSGTGMEPAEVHRRIQKDAKIAASHGDTFGKGGETFMRFNIGLPRAQIVEALERLQRAFADLQ
ncbi:Cystathionine beta-lyase PatB [Rhodobacteraceae bacterium THAF1]|uniref:MalY/PatB family protein n=1 Tax=Palleronia sp. THAF1 TaxID=2587842 RepID=UPI000F3EF5FE|nr:MalY/PatB family protein [Palleronia sp. THAF1]QFU07568.1 Cystathionine beta-lyase PatB [Palleronia sp. THAF1]VDC22877.1 Cystathionine beta-lyase PatB [Rhodobacteraceae bacterium THAF1]